jgi:hypothetical protein
MLSIKVSRYETEWVRKTTFLSFETSIIVIVRVFGKKSVGLELEMGEERSNKG